MVEPTESESKVGFQQAELDVVVLFKADHVMYSYCMDWHALTKTKMASCCTDICVHVLDVSCICRQS